MLYEILKVVLEPFIRIYKYRKIIYTTTVYDIKTKYSGSLLGMIWIVLYPILFLCMYALVYLMIFKIRLQIMSPYEYVLLIFSGLIPFLSFAEAIGRGVGSVVANSNLIKNTMFPIEFISVNVVFSSQILLYVGFFILSLINGYLGKLGLKFIVVPYIIFLQVLFMIGLVWFLSALNVFFRDIGQMVSLIILLLMMISPIAYTQDMIPDGLRNFLYLNPLYYLVILYQKIFMFNQIDVKFLIIFSFISFLHFILGYYFFIKVKGIFNDYI